MARALLVLLPPLLACAWLGLRPARCPEAPQTPDWRMTLKTIRNGVHKIDMYLNAALDLLGGEDGLCQYKCSDGEAGGGAGGRLASGGPARSDRPGLRGRAAGGSAPAGPGSRSRGHGAQRQPRFLPGGGSPVAPGGRRGVPGRRCSRRGVSCPAFQRRCGSAPNREVHVDPLGLSRLARLAPAHRVGLLAGSGDGFGGGTPTGSTGEARAPWRFPSVLRYAHFKYVFSSPLLLIVASVCFRYRNKVKGHFSN